MRMAEPTIEEKAQDVLNKVGYMEEKIREIRKVCGMVVYSATVGTDTFEWTAQQKQDLIAHYQTLKTELSALYASLP